MVRRVTLRFAFLTLALVSPLPAVLLPPAAVAAPQVSRLGIDAANAAFQGHFEEAGDMAKRSGDMAAIKLVELLYLRDKGKNAGFSRIMAFLQNAPRWPLSETLTKRAEQALYAEHADPTAVAGFFAKRKPLTPEGKLALARAALSGGNKADARDWVVSAYVNELLDGSLEAALVSEFGGLLTPDDHRRRLWEMVYDQETNAAIRTAKRLPGDYQAAAKACQALLRGAGGADKLYGGLSSAMRQQTAVQYALARYYRKHNADAKAVSILLKLPSSGLTTSALEALWVERRIMARKSLGPANQANWTAAYALARSHGFTSGPFLAEGEFLAGWIALRSLKDPQKAMKHFARLDAGAENRTEKARAKYWLGRSAAAMGNQGDARGYYEAASQYSTIFYGQLAREQIGLAKAPLSIPSGQPSAAARGQVESDEVARAFRMVAATGRDRDLNMFLWSLSRRFDSIDDMNAVASLAWDAGGAPLAVRLAKLAAQRNLDVDSWGYPTKSLPNWKAIGKPVEKALVFGLSRQESEFDAKAGSRVGAQGLMQLMPGTARLIANQYSVPYALSKLTADPAYNVKLGAAHLGDLIDDYNGSYVLTLVAYNAGPRRAREWVADYGDPRGGKIDPIDWVESIPFQETRQYVQKVLQNTQIYRSRLAPETMRALSYDLARGGPKAINVAVSEPGTASCASGQDGIEDLIKRCD